MSKKVKIRRLAAGIMMLVFAFSITPRILLHTWFASHTDATRKKSSASTQQQFSKSAFNCNCDNIVAESPFTDPGNIFASLTSAPFSLQQQMAVCSFYSVKHFLFSLRGPPLQS